MSQIKKNNKGFDTKNSSKEVKFELVQIEQWYSSYISLFIKNRTLFVIGRNTENERDKRIFFINDFYPRFYVHKEENLDIILPQIEGKIKMIKSKEDGEEYNFRNLKGDKELITIFTLRTSDIPDIRELFSKTYMADVVFTEVFKIIKKIRGFFYIPRNVLKKKDRRYKIKGVKYTLLFEREINGGELEF